MMSFNAAENGVEEMIVEVQSSVVQPEEIKSPSKKSEPGLPQITTGASFLLRKEVISTLIFLK